MKNAIKIIIKIVFVIVFFILVFVPVYSFIINSSDWLPTRNNLLVMIFSLSILFFTVFIAYKTITSIINGIYEKKRKQIIWGIVIYVVYFLIFLFLDAITFPMM